ncbi:MAG TPA: hypothetical protein PLP29_06985 [Candidatus Ozemobacteraceae bacterium]|nr:hypothetical protein [Candidatus Ozemobacteraceae bacterium]
MEFKHTIDAIAKKTPREEADARRAGLLRLDEPARGAEVGLWWLIENNIFRLAQPWSQAPEEDGWHMIEDIHDHAWADMKAALASRFPSIIHLRYNDPERGRVWYRPRENTFFITCSKLIKAEQAIIRTIMEKFGITAKAVRVVNDPQYDVRPLPLQDRNTPNEIPRI